MQIFFAFAKAPFNFCGQNRDFCLWATKKIFLLVFRMNSNSSKNDILLRNMIYGFRRMIYLLRKHDIISVPSYAAGIYHPPQVDIISKIYHPFRQERISLKNDKFLSKLVVFHGAGGGGRTRTVSLPPDFESGTSANSITPAKC